MVVRRKMTKLILYLLLGIACVTVLFPYYWMITCAIRNTEGMYTIPPILWSSNVTLDNYVRVFAQTRIPVYIGNSLITAISATLFGLMISIPAGYALARFNFRGKSGMTVGVLLFKLLPQTATLISLYIMYTNLGVLDKWYSLAFAQQFLIIPFAVWMSRGFIKTVPFSIEEAAMIDGCSKPKAILYVLIPIISAGIFAVGLYAFMLSWEEFLYSYTLTMSSARPVSVGLAMFMDEDGVDWGAVMATASIISVPILILFFFCEDSFVKGMTGGAVKG